jgi:sugar phosphate isomerase/epimerase
MWHNKQLSDDEMYERGVMYLKAAQKLGCKYIRLLHDAHIGTQISPYKLTTPEIAERLLPIAQECDVIMAIECHSPTSIEDPVQQAYLEPADRLGIPYIGLQADFSSYEFCMSTADIELCIHYGCTREVLEHLREKQRKAYFSGKEFSFDEIKGDFEGMLLNEHDKKYLDYSELAYHESVKFVKTVGSYDKLKEYAPKIIYCHGKFYDIDKDGQVDNMDYPRIFKALKEGGYHGFICSEFEGNRRLNLDHWCDEIEYVRKHQKLMRNCLKCDK